MSDLLFYKDSEMSVLSASVHDMSSCGWYSIGRQSDYSVEVGVYEEPIEIEFAGQACPWTRVF